VHLPQEPGVFVTKDNITMGRRILVVDDTAGAAKITARLLQLLGHKVEVAHAGRAAIERSRSFCPEIIMLDVSLPDMDGFEVAGQLRLLAETKGALIVALTGHSDDGYRLRAQQAGFDEFLVKPADVNSLRCLGTHPKLPTAEPSLPAAGASV
jgi:CheY-like chemotaxis protein